MIRIRRLALTALAAGALALGGPAAAALAGGHTDQPRPGAACSTVGATTTIDTAAGDQVYRCEQRDGDPCPVWHWQYDAGVPKGQHRPSRCPSCPSASPSVTTSPSTTSSPSTPSSGPPSTSAAATPSTSASTPALAVTGSPTGTIAGAGVALVAAGGGLVWLFRRRRVGAAT